MRVATPCTRLRDATLALVRGVPRYVTLKSIAEGAGLPEEWVRTFARGQIEEPSVNRIECLWEYLTKRQLQVD